MKTLFFPDLLRLLRRDINRAGGQSEWARQTGICRTYINRVLNGRKPPGPSIYGALGLKRAALRDVAKLSDATKVVDLEEVSLILREEIEKAGSISAWCQQVGLDRSHVSQVLHKRKRPGNKILAALKLSNVLLDVDNTRAAPRAAGWSHRPASTTRPAGPAPHQACAGPDRTASGAQRANARAMNAAGPR